MRKRKKRRQKQFLLLDKSILYLLTSDERMELDSKNTIIYPPILLVETARHGLEKPNALLNLENTVNVLHWAHRAKQDLLVGSQSRDYKIGARVPIKSIYTEPDDGREEMVRQAIHIVEGMDASAKKLKSHCLYSGGGRTENL